MKGARLVLYTAALSCIDATGKLDNYSMARLADECALSLRTTQEAVRLLARLEFLAQSDRGFQLIRYYQDEIQSARSRREVGGKICRAQEEGLRDSLETPPTPSQARGPFKLTRDERNRAAMRCERPQVEAVRSHLCTRCAVPHRWTCRGVECSCEFGREEWACDAAIAAARSP